MRTRINRVISLLMQAHRDIWTAYNDAWDSWTRFDQAYAVARRYYPSLSNTAQTNVCRLFGEAKG
jgi:hypothetical protein